MKALDTMKKALEEFIAFDRSVMLSVYAEDYGWGEDDYEADKEQASDFLEKVNRRMKSLGNHLSKGKNETQPHVPPAKTEPDTATA